MLHFDMLIQHGVLGREITGIMAYRAGVLEHTRASEYHIRIDQRPSGRA
jgi:hypothetical protein